MLQTWQWHCVVCIFMCNKMIRCIHDASHHIRSSQSHVFAVVWVFIYELVGKGEGRKLWYSVLREVCAKECSAMARSELEGCKWETVCRSNCLSLPFYLVLNASHSDLVWPPGAHAVVFVMASRVFFFFYTLHEKYCMRFASCQTISGNLTHFISCQWKSFASGMLLYTTFPLWHIGEDNWLVLFLSLSLWKSVTTDSSSETKLLFHTVQ